MPRSKSAHHLAVALAKTAIAEDGRFGQAAAQFYLARTEGLDRVPARNFGLKISVKEIK